MEETAKRSTNGSILWKCRCDCGNEILVTSTNLKNNHTKSCGCLQKEAASKTGKNNLIDLTGRNFGILTVIKKDSS